MVKSTNQAAPLEPREPVAYPRYPQRPEGARRPFYENCETVQPPSEVKQVIRSNETKAPQVR